MYPKETEVTTTIDKKEGVIKRVTTVKGADGTTKTSISTTCAEDQKIFNNPSQKRSIETFTKMEEIFDIFRTNGPRIAELVDEIEQLIGYYVTKDDEEASELWESSRLFPKKDFHYFKLDDGKNVFNIYGDSSFRAVCALSSILKNLSSIEAGDLFVNSEEKNWATNGVEKDTTTELHQFTIFNFDAEKYADTMKKILSDTP